MCTEVILDLLSAQPVGNIKFHGGGEYIKTVFQALAEEYQSEYRLIVCYDMDRFLDDWILKLIDEKKILTQCVKTASDIVDYIHACSQHGNVKFFAGMIYTYDQAQFPENVVCIGTCHGLRVLEKPYDRYAPYYIRSKADLKELVKMTMLKKRIMRKSQDKYENALGRFDVIITDSEHSAFSLRVNYPELMEKREIRVFYAPEKYVPPLKFDENVKKERFVLMISADRWLKNSFRGVMALDGLYQKRLLKGIKTKVLGNLPERIKKKIKCKDCFEFIGYVSPEELEQAYSECEVFFYPTLNEGFGLPPMEAMKYGKTCVISNVCSLPEIYGESVYYCNPYDVMEMQNRVLQAVTEKKDLQAIEEQLKKVRCRQRSDLDKMISLIENG